MRRAWSARSTTPTPTRAWPTRDDSPPNSKPDGHPRRRACGRASTTCSPCRDSACDGRLAKTLTNTNAIESMISIARRHRSCEALAGRQQDASTLVRGRDARSRTQLPARQGLQADAPTRRRARPSHRSCHTPEVRSGSHRRMNNETATRGDFNSQRDILSLPRGAHSGTSAWSPPDDRGRGTGWR